MKVKRKRIYGLVCNLPDEKKMKGREVCLGLYEGQSWYIKASHALPKKKRFIRKIGLSDIAMESIVQMWMDIKLATTHRGDNETD